MTESVPSCETADGCITCGDVAVVMTVLDVAGHDARCADDKGRSQRVALDFVTARRGDRVLVHAGVALERLPASAGSEDESNAVR